VAIICLYSSIVKFSLAFVIVCMEVVAMEYGRLDDFIFTMIWKKGRILINFQMYLLVLFSEEIHD
jgi:hypothetical protein